MGLRRRARSGIHAVLGLCAAAWLAGCAATDDLDPDPVTRTLTWFSYLNGDDLRRACGPGSPDRLRLVFNGVNVEQVRTYDARVTAEGAVLDIRVVTGAKHFGDWTVGEAGDLLDPWRGDKARVHLRPVDFDLLKRAVRGTPGVPPGTRLPSWDFWWIAVGCLEGEMGFKAYLWPKAYPESSFIPLLRAWDPIDVALATPRETDPDWIYGSDEESRRSARRFELRVEEGGLFGVNPLFGR